MKRKRYTKEFKKRAVELLQHRGSRSADEVAEELGVSQGHLFRWRRELGEEAGYKEQLVDTSANEQDEVEKLRRRVRELEQETAFLKKAAAFFAKEIP